MPAAVGPSGDGAARGEHQRAWAALVRAQAWRGVVQARLAAYGGDGAGKRRRHGGERAWKPREREGTWRA